MIFRWESIDPERLEVMPCTVRRKLDESGLRISLRVWQSLAVSARAGLMSEPDETFAKHIRELCAQHQLELREQPVESCPWTLAEVPEEVRVRINSYGYSLSSSRWTALSLDARFALVHLSRTQREPERLQSLADELALPPLA